MTNVVLKRCEIFTAATPKTTKLYGQIKPKIKSGGCQTGGFNDRYQLSPVLTQSPEPMA